MRPILLSMMIVAVTAQPSFAARRASKPRSVEVIAMGQAAQNAAGARDGGREATSPAAAPAFRVHDLRRRWIEHQLRTSYQSTPINDAPNGEDPFRPIGTPPIMQELAVAAGSMQVATASSIVAPGWMSFGGVAGAPYVPMSPGCASAGYRPSGMLNLAGEERRRAYFSMMSSIACDYGVPVGLFDALIIRESQYQPGIYSPKLAYGLTQLMPDTARSMGVNRYDPVDNLRGGARYLREQLDRFGRYHLALAAYNAGPGRVRGGLVPAIPETQAYVSNVIGNWSRLSGAGTSTSVNAQPIAFTGTRPNARTRQVSLAVF